MRRLKKEKWVSLEALQGFWDCSPDKCTTASIDLHSNE